jgi:hypothetical protein
VAGQTLYSSVSDAGKSRFKALEAMAEAGRHADKLEVETAFLTKYRAERGITSTAHAKKKGKKDDSEEPDVTQEALEKAKSAFGGLFK